MSAASQGPLEAWADYFDGETARVQRVLLTLAPDRLTIARPDGSRLDAWTYVFRPQYRSLLQTGDWDVEAFRRDGKRRFEARYLGFRQIQQ